jgi:hypothetical protein
MKPRIVTLVCLFTLAFSSVFANDDDNLVEKTKTYTKSYTVSSSDRISLENQFGEMKINTWDKNEIRVDVKIVTKGSTDEIAQKILDNIYIEDSKTGSEVSFETKMRNKNMNWNNDNEKKYKEMGMKIDYIVSLPATNQLSATNQFGPMSITDFRGPVTLISKFGSLTAGKLSNVKEVDVEFGEGSIESVTGGKLTVKFSKAEIKNVYGNVVARIEFCDKLKIGLDNNTKDLDIKSSYSTLYLDAASNLSSSISIKTSFGDFDNKTSFNIKKEGDDDDEKYGPKFDKQFSGNAGAGANKLKVRSDFGGVILGHNLQVDMSSKDKNKNKVKV